LEDRSELPVWQAQTRQSLDQLGREEESANLTLNNWRDAATQLQEKIQSQSAADAGTKRWLTEQSNMVQNNLDLYQNYLSYILLSKKLCERFDYELNVQLAQVPFRDRVARIWRGFLGVWSFELTAVDDSPITVSKITTALLLILVGL